MAQVENENGELVESRGIGPSGQHLVGEPRETTIRQLIRDEYGYSSLDDACVARDFGALDRARELLEHRGYDSPITVQVNQDGYDEILAG